MANIVFIDYFNPFAKPESTLLNSVASDVSNRPKYRQDDTSLVEKGTTVEQATVPEREVLACPLIENFELQINTNFKKPKEYLPGLLSNIADLANLVKSLSGRTSRQFNILDILDVPIWDSTEPLRFDIKLQFFTETDPYADVVRPIYGLASQSMLSPANLGKPTSSSFLLPGINFSNLTQVTNKNESSATVSSEAFNLKKKAAAKIIAIEVPGLIYLPTAMIEKCTPTFSKDITESGFPLWGEITITVMSLRSANTDMLLSVSGLSEDMDKIAAQYQRQLSSASSDLI